MGIYLRARPYKTSQTEQLSWRSLAQCFLTLCSSIDQQIFRFVLFLFCLPPHGHSKNPSSPWSARHEYECHNQKPAHSFYEVSKGILILIFSKMDITFPPEIYELGHTCEWLCFWLETPAVIVLLCFQNTSIYVCYQHAFFSLATPRKLHIFTSL